MPADAGKRKYNSKGSVGFMGRMPGWMYDDWRPTKAYKEYLAEGYGRKKAQAMLKASTSGVTNAAGGILRGKFMTETVWENTSVQRAQREQESSITTDVSDVLSPENLTLVEGLELEE